MSQLSINNGSFKKAEVPQFIMERTIFEVFLWYGVIHLEYYYIDCMNYELRSQFAIGVFLLAL